MLLGNTVIETAIADPISVFPAQTFQSLTFWFKINFVQVGIRTEDGKVIKSSFNHSEDKVKWRKAIRKSIRIY